MPAATPETRFIRYELQAVRGTSKLVRNRAAPIRRRWNALTQNQKDQYITLLNVVEADQREAKACDREATEAAAEADRRGAIVPIDFRAYMIGSQAASDAYRLAEEAHDALEQALRRFGTACQTLQNGPDVMQYIRNQRIAAGNAVCDARHQKNVRLVHAKQPPQLPARADGVRKIEERWMAHAHKQQRKRLRMDAFLTAGLDIPPDDDLVWQGAWPIGRGGQGFAAVWVQLDDDEVVVDRIVQKEVHMSRAEWSSVFYWVGDLSDADDRKPMEGFCQDRLSSINATNGFEGRVNVPELRDGTDVNNPFRINNDRRIYRLIMEYCPYGDLRRFTDDKGPLPEPFVWRIFHSLAQIVLAMERGHTDFLNTKKTKDWKEIVHRDLKPHNIFLAAPTNDFFPAYPTPMVGDFGAAIRTHRHDPLNPEMYLNGTRTVGFIAPEQMAYVDGRDTAPVDRHRMLARTNVYGIGCIMYTLVTGREHPRQPQWLSSDNSDSLDVHADRHDGQQPWTDRLMDLIQECLDFHPGCRPTPGTLLRSIEDAIDDDPESESESSDSDSDGDDQRSKNQQGRKDKPPRNFAQNMRTTRPDKMAPNDMRRLPPLREDQYRVGLAFNRLPPWPAPDAVPISERSTE